MPGTPVSASATVREPKSSIRARSITNAQARERLAPLHPIAGLLVDENADAVIDRFCLLGPPAAHIERLEELRDIGVDQFALYLQHDSKVPTLEAYGETIIPALIGAPIAKD